MTPANTAGNPNPLYDPPPTQGHAQQPAHAQAGTAQQVLHFEDDDPLVDAVDAEQPVFDDLSSDSDTEMQATSDDSLAFVKGSTTQGNVHVFIQKMIRFIRGSRAASYDLVRQVQSIASRCDDVTYDKIQMQIARNMLRLNQNGWVWLKKR